MNQPENDHLGDIKCHRLYWQRGTNCSLLKLVKNVADAILYRQCL